MYLIIVARKAIVISKHSNERSYIAKSSQKDRGRGGGSAIAKYLKNSYHLIESRAQEVKNDEI